MIKILNRRTGMRLGGVYIGRPSALGNPYVIGRDGDRATVIAKYEAWLRKQSASSPAWKEIARLKTIHQKEGMLNLVCWCAPLPCHGDVIRKIILE